MRAIMAFLLGSVLVGVLLAQQPAQEKPADATAQKKLEETCTSIKSGQLQNPPAALADVCRTLEQEQEKKKDDIKANMQFAAGKLCGAPWAPDSPQSARVIQLLPKTGPTFHRRYPNENVTFLVVKSPIINAWTIVGAGVTEKGNPRSFVCLPTAVIDFFSSDGELAFIIGHETGHAVDQTCKGQRKDLATQRICEARADAVGFDIIVNSGFNPYDAGAAFGKLEMYSGDTRTDMAAQFAALGRDHPMTPDRVQHMHDMMAQYNAVLKGPLAH